MKKPSKIAELNNNLAQKQNGMLELPKSRHYKVGRLEKHEQQIDKHLSSIDRSFFEIGRELAEIQQEQDYAEQTFEEYLRNRWKKSRDWGYKMIEGYQVKAALPQNVENFLQNQGQAIALSKVPEKERASVLKEVAKKGKVTAAKIKEQAVESDFRVIVKDANDTDVPEEIATEFQRSRTETKEIRSKLQEIRRWFEDEQLFKVEIDRSGAIDSIRDLLSMIAVASADYICPICKGSKCKVCSKRGFVSKLFYSQKISDDKK